MDLNPSPSILRPVLDCNLILTYISNLHSFVLHVVFLTSILVMLFKRLVMWYIIQDSKYSFYYYIFQVKYMQAYASRCFCKQICHRPPFLLYLKHCDKMKGIRLSCMTETLTMLKDAPCWGHMENS